MNTVTTESQKIHPHKLMMWIAICSICMMFAGWTSGFLVRKGQGNWMLFSLPTAFWISSAVVIISSITMHFAVKNYKANNFATYKSMFSITALLGVVFMLLQLWGFHDMHNQGITLASNGEGVSGSFIYVISWVHIVHMLGGVIALVIMFFVNNFRKKRETYNSTGLEILSTYWHFVDILWICLFLFFMFNQK